MKKTASENLKESILELEKKKEMHLNGMKEKVHEISESMKPKNILKSALENTLGDGSEIKNSFVNTIAGLGVGYVFKKLLTKGAGGIRGKVAGNILQLVVANLVAQNSDTLMEWGKKAIQFIKSKKKDPEE